MNRRVDRHDVLPVVLDSFITALSVMEGSVTANLGFEAKLWAASDASDLFARKSSMGWADRAKRCASNGPPLTYG